METASSASSFLPHGYCIYWQADLLYLHVVSDIIIAIAYFSIPATLLYVMHQRRQRLPYRWVFALFALFILLCGSSHLIELATLWYPIYYVEGVVKMVTAAASIATALLMFPLIPELLDRLAGPPAKIVPEPSEGAQEVGA